MPEPSVERRAARMSAISVGRQLLNLPLGLLSAVILARLFAPADFGRFGILVFLTTLPLLAGDLGLTQAFIRQRDEPDVAALRSAASLQVWIAVLALPVILVLATRAIAAPLSHSAPMIALLYAPTLGAGWALRANVRVARGLDFARLSALDIVQQIIYVLLLFALGRAGLGTLGLVVTAAATQVGRLAVLVWWYPLRPALRPRLAPLKGTIVSGLPLHLSGIVSGFHAGMVNWLGTPLFGPAAVGFLRWAVEITSKAGITLAQGVGRVVFPTVALLQGDPARVGRVVARACRYNLLVVGVPLALLAGLAQPVISAVFGGRWVPAVTPLQVYAVHMTLGALVISLDAAVQVLRRTTWMLGVWVGYLALEVALAVALAPLLGLVAIPVAQLAATAPKAVLMRHLLPAGARPRWSTDVGLPAAAALGAFALARAAALALSPWPAILAGGTAGALAATVIVFLLGRDEVWPDLLTDVRRLAPERSPA